MSIDAMVAFCALATALLATTASTAAVTACATDASESDYVNLMTAHYVNALAADNQFDVVTLIDLVDERLAAAAAVAMLMHRPTEDAALLHFMTNDVIEVGAPAPATATPPTPPERLRFVRTLTAAQFVATAVASQSTRNDKSQMYVVIYSDDDLGSGIWLRRVAEALRRRQASIESMVMFINMPNTCNGAQVRRDDDYDDVHADDRVEPPPSLLHLVVPLTGGYGGTFYTVDWCSRTTVADVIRHVQAPSHLTRYPVSNPINPMLNRATLATAVATYRRVTADQGDHDDVVERRRAATACAASLPAMRRIISLGLSEVSSETSFNLLPPMHDNVASITSGGNKSNDATAAPTADTTTINGRSLASRFRISVNNVAFRRDLTSLRIVNNVDMSDTFITTFSIPYGPYAEVSDACLDTNPRSVGIAEAAIGHAGDLSEADHIAHTDKVTTFDHGSPSGGWGCRVSGRNAGYLNLVTQWYNLATAAHVTSSKKFSVRRHETTNTTNWRSPIKRYDAWLEAAWRDVSAALGSQSNVSDGRKSRTPVFDVTFMGFQTSVMTPTNDLDVTLTPAYHVQSAFVAYADSLQEGAYLLMQPMLLETWIAIGAIMAIGGAYYAFARHLTAVMSNFLGHNLMLLSVGVFAIVTLVYYESALAMFLITDITQFAESIQELLYSLVTWKFAASIENGAVMAARLGRYCRSEMQAGTLSRSLTSIATWVGYYASERSAIERCIVELHPSVFTDYNDAFVAMREDHSVWFGDTVFYNVYLRSRPIISESPVFEFGEEAMVANFAYFILNQRTPLRKMFATFYRESLGNALTSYLDAPLKARPVKTMVGDPKGLTIRQTVIPFGMILTCSALAIGVEIGSLARRLVGRQSTLFGRGNRVGVVGDDHDDQDDHDEENARQHGPLISSSGAFDYH